MKKSIIIFVLVLLVVVGAIWVASTKDFFKKEVAQTVKVGILYKGNNFQKVVDGFVEGFEETLPKNILVEYVIKNETGTEQKDFDISANVLVESKVDVILAVGLEPSLAAKKATIENKTPVIFGIGTNPVKLGLVESFQRPGGNITGVVWQVEELSGKRLEFLSMINPQVKRITIFRKKESSAMNGSFEYLNPVAVSLGMVIKIKEFTTLEELQKEVLATSLDNTDAIFYAPDPFVSRNTDFIIKHALEKKLPIMLHDAFFVEKGALASYGGNFFSAGKQISRLAGKILFEKYSPAEIPVEAVSKIDFAINLKTAKTIDLVVPDDVILLSQIVIKE